MVDFPLILVMEIDVYCRTYIVHFSESNTILSPLPFGRMARHLWLADRAPPIP